MRKLHAASQHPVARQHPDLIPTHLSVASQHPWCNWLHGSVLLSFESPLWWGNYMRLASILWPDSTQVSSLLTLMWPVSTQSPRSWDDFTGVFFFLLIYPGVEKTPYGQPAPCSQTAPWSHPYIPMWPVSTQSPSRLQSPWRWVNTMRPASILWLNSPLVPPRLIPLGPVSTLGVTLLHWYSPWWWGNSMRPANSLVSSPLIPMWPVSTLDASWQQHSVLLTWEST